MARDDQYRDEESEEEDKEGLFREIVEWRVTQVESLGLLHDNDDEWSTFRTYLEKFDRLDALVQSAGEEAQHQNQQQEEADRKLPARPNNQQQQRIVNCPTHQVEKLERALKGQNDRTVAVFRHGEEALKADLQGYIQVCEKKKTKVGSQLSATEAGRIFCRLQEWDPFWTIISIRVGLTSKVDVCKRLFH